MSSISFQTQLSFWLHGWQDHAAMHAIKGSTVFELCQPCDQRLNCVWVVPAMRSKAQLCLSCASHAIKGSTVFELCQPCDQAAGIWFFILLLFQSDLIECLHIFIDILRFFYNTSKSFQRVGLVASHRHFSIDHSIATVMLRKLPNNGFQSFPAIRKLCTKSLRPFSGIICGRRVSKANFAPARVQPPQCASSVVRTSRLVTKLTAALHTKTTTIIVWRIERWRRFYWWLEELARWRRLYWWLEVIALEKVLLVTGG